MRLEPNLSEVSSSSNAHRHSSIEGCCGGGAATASTGLPSSSTVPSILVPAPGDRRTYWWNRLQFRGPLLARRTGEREALFLTLLCALDMYTTLWWVLNGHAVEANPHLEWTFRLNNPVLFVFLKCATCLPALLLAPLLAQRHPLLVTWLLRGVIVAYIGVYLASVK